MGNKTARGSLSTITFAPETVYGTRPAANTFTGLSFTSESLASTINPVVSTEITPDRTVPSVRGGNRASNGTVTTDFGINRFSLWLRHLLGGTLVKTTLNPVALAAGTFLRGDYVTSTGNLYVCITGGTEIGNPALNATDGDIELPGGTAWNYVGASNTPVYKYVLTAGRDLPTGGITMEATTNGGDVSMSNLWVGGRINSLNLTIPQETDLQSAWDFMFTKSYPRTTATYAQNPAELIDKSIIGSEAVFTINGSENYDIREGSISITNNMDGNDYRLGSRDRKAVNEQRRECKGQFTAYFTDTTLYDEFENEDVMDIEFSVVRGGDFLSFEYPEAKFFGDPRPKTGGAGTITAQFDVTAYKENGAFDVQVVIKTTNNALLQ